MNEKEFARAIGSIIAQKRRIMGMTQQQLGELIEIETESVSRLETGATTPTFRRLLQLSTIFNCPLTDFFCFATNNNIDNAAIIANMLEKLSVVEQKNVIDIIRSIVHMLQK